MANPFLGTAAFDPETTAALASAFDKAWETVKRSGSPLAKGGNTEATREELAKHIVAAAHEGERDPQRLVERALSHLAQRFKTRPLATPDGSSP